MEYLQLGKQRPKPIPSYRPLIDDDFLCFERKKRQPVDEKTLKRKIKAEEKKVARELRKDTEVIQQEKQRLKQQKQAKFRKQTFRGGNAPKDEV